EAILHGVCSEVAVFKLGEPAEGGKPKHVLLVFSNILYAVASQAIHCAILRHLFIAIKMPGDLPVGGKPKFIQMILVDALHGTRFKNFQLGNSVDAVGLNDIHSLRGAYPYTAFMIFIERVDFIISKS